MRIPKVKTWTVKIIDTNNRKLIDSCEVVTINKRFAIWCAIELGLYLKPNQRYSVSLRK